MQSVVIQCKSCGLRFVNHAAKRHIAAKRKYCDDCLSARRRINAAGTKKESIRECKECGERFFGHTSAAYCSDRCSRSAKRRAAAKYRELSALCRDVYDAIVFNEGLYEEIKR